MTSEPQRFHVRLDDRKLRAFRCRVRAETPEQAEQEARRLASQSGMTFGSRAIVVVEEEQEQEQ